MLFFRINLIVDGFFCFFVFDRSVISHTSNMFSGKKKKLCDLVDIIAKILVGMQIR